MKNKLVSLAFAGSLALFSGCGKNEFTDQDTFYRIGGYVGVDSEFAERLGNEYPNPNKIIFNMIDEDNDGRNELILKYEGKEYYVRVDSTTNLSLVLNTNKTSNSKIK